MGLCRTLLWASTQLGACPVISDLARAERHASITPAAVIHDVQPPVIGKCESGIGDLVRYVWQLMSEFSGHVSACLPTDPQTSPATEAPVAAHPPHMIT